MASEEVLGGPVAAGSDDAHLNADGAWGGGVAPFAIVSKKLGMWLFIVSDAITFRCSARRVQLRPRSQSALAHAVSGVAQHCQRHPDDGRVAGEQPHYGHGGTLGEGRKPRAHHSLAACNHPGRTGVRRPPREGMGRPHRRRRASFQNPWGTPLFGAAFFSLTGLHMTHVTVGVVYLAIVAFGQSLGKFKPEDVEVSGLYWHFVDLVWMFIFPLVYLMSAARPS